MTTNHDSSPSFSRFAMDDSHIFGVLLQPHFDVLAEGFDRAEVRGVVVVEWVRGHAVVELLGVVGPLRAEVVDEVVVQVVLVKVLLHLKQK